jgi:hypothetical protein
MRLAGSPQVYEALTRRSPAGEAPQATAVVAGPGAGASTADPGTGLDRFLELHALLRSKGYSEQAAQHSALEMVAGREPEAQTTRRFAGMYGETPC